LGLGEFEGNNRRGMDEQCFTAVGGETVLDKVEEAATG
jgi:hypothetical protein|tara:strand:- start:10624 stop:10737 length:114 start_codon:yes stop_codon:yes gene_type:complete